jgi:FkbM family methyltransferase
LTSIKNLSPFSLNKYTRRLYRKRNKYIRALGKEDGLKAFEILHDKIKEDEHTINLPGLRSNIYLRPKTSDRPTFEQVFVQKEYELPIDFSPKTMIDGGANIGLASVYFAERFPDLHIFAIEPDTSNLEMFAKNTSHYDNVEGIQSAIWNRTTQLKISNPEMDSWAFEVEETTDEDVSGFVAHSILDLMKLKKWDQIDILKLDIEGSEYQVFQADYEQWLPKVKMLIIELHEKMRPGCTQVLKDALGHYDFKTKSKGENLVFYNQSFT